MQISLGASKRSIQCTGVRRARQRGIVAANPNPSFSLKTLKVNVAKAVVDLAPGEAGLRLLSRAFPSKIRGTFDGLLSSYKSQLLVALGDDDRAATAVTSIFKDMIKAYAEQLLGESYTFPSFHRAIREPFDYYQMANAYIGSLIDFDRSILRYSSRWSKVQQQLEAGENVIFLGNHQSEGDAAFIPLLTEVSHPGLGEQVIYVAGGRVVSDLLAKPFSMGKNLLCVVSKKHMDEDAAKKSAQMKQNLTTLKEMQLLLNKGGALIWIAPAGGRDRRKPDGTLIPDEFDPQAVEMMRKLGTKKTSALSHFYPLAMATYDIMPPPATTEKELGEKRVVNYTGVGLSLGEEIDVSDAGEWRKEIAAGEDMDEAKQLSTYIWRQVLSEYLEIDACNVPGGETLPLPADSLRPVRPPSVPKF